MSNYSTYGFIIVAVTLFKITLQVLTPPLSRFAKVNDLRGNYFGSIHSTTSGHCILECKITDNCEGVRFWPVKQRCALYTQVCEILNRNIDLIAYVNWEQRYLDVACEPGWGRCKDSCYHFSAIQVDWYTARNTCIAMDSHLATISDEQEQDVVLSTRYYEGANRRYHFIGGYGTYFNFAWQNDEIWDYTNFGFPMPSYFGPTETCIGLYQSDEHGWVANKWGDVLCTSLNYFVCEKSVFQ